MLLFIKGLIIGIAKIVPGVSGAVLAINFNVYNQGITAITDFFSSPKNHLKFIIILGSGIILSIILCSKLILYLITNYYFLTMCFFIGLLLNGTISFKRKIKLNIKQLVLSTLIISLFLIILINIPINNINLLYFISGIIEITSTIIPGISGTSIYMLLDIYDKILSLSSNLLNYSYIINNLNIYLFYGLGMLISFIFIIYLIKYLINKHNNFFNNFIFLLSFISIILLIFKTIQSTFTILELLLGIILLISGYIISSIIDN